MSTASTLKLALELAAKVTGREDLAALAGEVQELGPISDETAAETARLAQTLDGLSQQQELIAQFNQSADALTQLELASVLSRDKLATASRYRAGPCADRPGTLAGLRGQAAGTPAGGPGQDYAEAHPDHRAATIGRHSFILPGELLAVAW